VARLAAARAHLDRACASFSPTLRAHAAGALALLGERDRKCLTAPAAASPAAELGRPAAAARLVLDTDVGELTINVDPSWTPVAAARLVDLARAGFYDGMAVHRVVPGFVVQFGDRAGDGTGAAGREPLRCETAPVAFGPLAVGVALDGRDTGSSQFFVTLARTPHLDGDYARVGAASGDWAAVAEGDVIRKVSVAP
jgi:cyclophilin family peptidyl-prolyl cis-trans isomerase